MSPEEFQTWMEDLGNVLPETHAYMVALPSETRKSWYETWLSHHTLDDCCQATRQILEDGFRAYDREQLAFLVAKAAKVISKGKIAAQGLSDPKTLPHWKRETYTCHECRDTGMITIWAPKTMQNCIWWRRGLITEDAFRNHRKRMVAPCQCEQGDPYTTIKTFRDGKVVSEKPVVRYCVRRMVKPDFAEHDEAVSLIGWADEWCAKHDAGKSTNPRAVASFDDFNREEF